MRLIRILIIHLLVADTVIFSQTSLFRGVNPYASNNTQGEIVRVNVSSVFSVVINGEWNRDIEVNLKLEPDKKNLPFLNSSEQSKNNNRKSKERQNVVEKFSFTISAIVTAQADGTYKINANRIINMDGKITRVILTGVTDAKSIVNGGIHSDAIADLNLTILSQPQPALDNTYQGNDDKGKPGEPGTEANQQGFSQEQTKKYVIEYMKEILGGLK